LIKSFGSSTKVYIDEALTINNDGLHRASTRLCVTKQLTSGKHSIYVVGFATYLDSELEVTYAGPDTYGVRTVIGGQPFFSACDPRSPMTAAAAFTLCTFKSDPTSAWNGDCTPTEGIAHPRYPGPCAKAIGTVSKDFEAFSGGFYSPILGSASEALVRKFISFYEHWDALFWQTRSFFCFSVQEFSYCLTQSDVHFVGWTLLNTTSIGPAGGQGLLAQLVPGTPDCRAEPVGDGLIGVDGQNCPFQMYSISGTFNISQSGSYTFSSTSSDGLDAC
jgi:hypothetical protein